MNPLLKGIHRLGISVQGSQTLAIRGRKSGEWRTIPVNPLTLDGSRYLVAEQYRCSDPVVPPTKKTKPKG